MKPHELPDAFLLDASTWLAAVDRSDRSHDDARDLVRLRSVLALDLTLYEVANVAVRAWRQPHRARALVELVLGATDTAPITVSPSLVLVAAGLADTHRITVYDASYAAVAADLGCILVSLDVRDLVSNGLAISPAEALNR